MKTTDVDRAAALLVSAAREGRWLPELPPSLRPSTLEEAYAIQEAATVASGRIARGWKIGCTSPQTQALLGTDRPMAGRVFADRLHTSPAVLHRFRRDMPLIEAEFAFRFVQALPCRARPYPLEAVLEAVGSMHLALELVESRFENWRAPQILDSIADNSSHGALVLGASIEGWRALDLASIAVRLHAGGRTIAQGEGRRVLGNPLNVLLWLAEFLRSRGLAIAAGDVVTTGTCLGAPEVPLGTPVTGEFAGLGEVHLELALQERPRATQ